MIKLSTKIPRILLTVSLLFFLILPQGSAHALIGDIIKGGASFYGCAVAGKASPFLSEKINDGINKLKGLASRIPGIGKILGAGGSGGSAVPVAVPVYDESLLKTHKSKEYTQDVETRCAAIEILNYLNININGLVRTSGRNGGPAFVRNWRNFQTDSQYRGEGIFRAVLSNTKLCNYFNKDIKDLFGATKKTSLSQNTRTGNLDPYALRANCTMPSNFNLANYQNDFAGNGGWNAWSRMLEPQNNYYGALFGALDETAKQRALEESADLNQVVANKGFTGKSGKDANDSCKTKDANGKCLEYKDIQTPGDTIAESVAASIKSELDIVISADEVNELLSTAVSVLLNRLNNLSDPNEGDYISPNVDLFDPDNFPIPPPDSGSGLTCTDVPSALACVAPNHVDLVGRVKDYLIAQNINISGFCGAFEITKRVAWALQGDGAGVLKTWHSGQCNGFAAGNIAYTDNSGVDILSDEGGDNTPGWGPGPSQNDSGVYYVAPTDPGDPAGSY